MAEKRGRTPGLTREQVNARKRRLAELVTEAESGMHQYPDGSTPVMANGQPRVNKLALMVEAGYTPFYAKKEMTRVFQNPYYLEQKALIEHQRQGGLMRALVDVQERSGVFTNIADRMALLLQQRLDDPIWSQKIRTEDLFKYALQYHKLDLEVQGALSGNKQNQLAVVFMDAEERLPKESRDKMRDALTKFRALKSGELDDMARVGDAMDDVIEGEATDA
jgi:hypothetical protein